MNKVETKVFLHHNKEVMELNEDNEWLEELLSDKVSKKKKSPPKKINRMVSNSQRLAVKGKM